MKFLKEFLDRRKDWHLNREKFGLVEFIAFHDVDTNLNLLFDKQASYLNNDFSSFDYFSPDGLTRDKLKQGFDVENYFLEESHPTFSILFENEKQSGGIRAGCVCRFNHPNSSWTHTTLQFFTKSNYSNFPSLIHSEGLYFAYYAELDYIYWQSNGGVVATYKYRGGLKYTKNKHGIKSIDITDRPGRTVYTKYFNYCGASKMWFGPMIYQYIPQELILQFEGAVEIKVLENNITYVHLYEGIYDGDEPKNQEVQRRFREHIKIDEIKVE